MKDLYPYSAASLEEMFSLRKGDISLLIESEGVPFYSPIRDEFIGYLPSLGSAFALNALTAKTCLRNINKEALEISMEDSVLSIKTKNRSIPPTSFLYTNIWLEKAQQMLDVTEPKISLLISNRTDAPVFCGHEEVISRLAISFEGDIKIVNVNHFIRWQS